MAKSRNSCEVRHGKAVPENGLLNWKTGSQAVGLRTRPWQASARPRFNAGRPFRSEDLDRTCAVPGLSLCQPAPLERLSTRLSFDSTLAILV